MSEDLPNLFDWMVSINETKQDLRPADPAMKNYVPFVINLGLAQHIDTLYAADDMNTAGDIPKTAHYQYLLNTVRPRQRRGKWVKAVREEELESVMSYYQCSRRVAAQYARLLTVAQLQEIQEIMGPQDDKNKNTNRGTLS